LITVNEMVDFDLPHDVRYERMNPLKSSIKNLLRYSEFLVRYLPRRQAGSKFQF